LAISGHQCIREHSQKRIVYRNPLLISYLFVAAGYNQIVKGLRAGMIDHFRVIVLHGLTDAGVRDRSMLNQFSVLIPVVVNSVNVVYIPVELVITKLKIDILKDKQAGRYAHGEPNDIDKRKDLIFPEIPPGSDQIAF
jgi:hypothetical protein